VSEAGQAQIWDLVVVGAGPAGIACAVQAQREGWRSLVIGDEPPGGLLPAARRIDNLPGYGRGISGAELSERLRRHLSAAGAEWRPGTVTSLQAGPPFALQTSDGPLEAHRVCLATGTRPRPLPPMLEALPGIARDVRGLPDDMGSQRAVVIGGGDAAFDSALTLADRGSRVTVVIRGARPRAARHLLDEARERVEVRLEAALAAAAWDGEGYELSWADGSGERAHLLLAAIGRVPRDDLLPEGRHPIQDVDGGVTGLAVAGDLIRAQERYIATALGDGQRAALWLADSP
jgi:thioredoxin reductase (NADPH)